MDQNRPPRSQASSSSHGGTPGRGSPQCALLAGVRAGLPTEGYPFPLHVNGYSFDKFFVKTTFQFSVSPRVLILAAFSSVNRRTQPGRMKYETGNCVRADRDNATTQDPPPSTLLPCSLSARAKLLNNTAAQWVYSQRTRLDYVCWV